jgi:hypothetical protein
VIRGLNAGFGECLTKPLLHALRAKGVGAIRQGIMPPPCGDLRPGQIGAVDAPRSAALVAELAGWPVWWLANRETLPHVPNGSHVTILNEPNLHGWSATRYALYLRRCLEVADAKGCTLWAGSVANLSATDLTWLRSLLRQVPEITHVDVHWYPREQDQDPRRPKPGFRSLEAQFWTLTETLAGRAWTCSEFGIHQAPMTRGWWLWKSTTRLGQREQKARLAWMCDILESHGCTAGFIYQLNDGPTDTPEDRRGIRMAGGTWKASAGVFTR